MAPRSRKARTASGYARARARDDAARARLVPLAPGERPLAVTVAALVAALVGVLNVALLAAGWEVRGEEPSAPGALAFATLMLAAGVAMWQCRYWAVLGFQALLGISITFAALGLLVASNVAAIAIAATFVLAGGVLFWFLVKAMARLQMPTRPRDRVG